MKEENNNGRYESGEENRIENPDDGAQKDGADCPAEQSGTASEPERSIASQPEKGRLGYYDPEIFASKENTAAASSSPACSASSGSEGGGRIHDKAPGNEKTPKSKRKGLKIFLIVVCVFLVMALLFGLFWPSDRGGSAYEPVSQEHIAVINVEGTIAMGSDGYTADAYNQSWLLNTIDGVMNNTTNQGILLYLNTPGGSVYATDEVYLKLLEYKEKTGRPVYAALGPTAASGGYYMAVAADRIYANRNTITGSIGVTMGTYYDISELLENLGIKTQTLTSGPNKAMGDSTQPMTQQQIEIYQSIIDESYQQFLDVVQMGRGIDRESLVSIADGRVYTAKQALDLGLIDGIATKEETLELMMQENSLFCSVAEYSYQPDTPFWIELLGGVSQAVGQAGTDQLTTALQLMEDNPTEPMYIMQ